MKTKLKHPMFGIRSSGQQEIIRALGNVGVLRLSGAVNVFGREQVQSLEQTGFIKRDTQFVRGRNETYVHLEKRGRDYARRYLVFGSLYKRSSYQLAHDLTLADKYLDLSREERKSWMNDYAVKKYVEVDDPNAEPVDGAYRNDAGQIVGVEVFTSSYDSATVSAKLDTLRMHFDAMAVISG